MGQLMHRYFTARVLKANVVAADCDVLLSTVHAARGAEWDNMVVLDDLVPFAKFERTDSNSSRLPYEFDVKDWGDDLNLWYVACTRAMWRLAVPLAFVEMRNAFECAKEAFRNQVLGPSGPGAEATWIYALYLKMTKLGKEEGHSPLEIKSLSSGKRTHAHTHTHSEI